ncbi:MAG TPA: DUF1461 domain-containing protein [Candidatus Nanoarchaeia archaeon]|nr:DUF1461 domain-containing protein [Candidatus Nanoarchaeia archaeon]
MRKFVEIVLVAAVILLIPLFLVLSSFQSLLADEDFFYEGFEKYGVYAALPAVDVNKFHRDLIEYLISEKTDAEFSSIILNEKEKIHLVDVKNLIQPALLLWKIATIAVILLIFLLISLQFNDWRLLRSLVAMFSIGSLLTIIILAAFLASVLLNFSSMFVSFHEILFTNDFWMLNPAVDNLKAVYADGIFYDFTVSLAIRVLVYSIILLLLSIAIFKYSRKRKALNEISRGKLENEQDS